MKSQEYDSASEGRCQPDPSQASPSLCLHVCAAVTPSVRWEVPDSVGSVTTSSEGARWGAHAAGSDALTMSVAVFDRLASQMTKSPRKFVAETEKLKHHKYSGKLSRRSAPGDFISSSALVLKEANCLDKKRVVFNGGRGDVVKQQYGVERFLEILNLNAPQKTCYPG